MTLFSISTTYFPRTLIQTYLELQAEELQASLTKAGIDLSDADLEQFIKAMDRDGDGVIDYEEWRDFLVVSQNPAFFFLVILVIFSSFSSFSLCSLSSTSRRSLSIMVTRFHTGRAKITRCKEIEIRLAVARIQEEHKQRATEKRVDKWDSMQFRI